MAATAYTDLDRAHGRAPLQKRSRDSMARIVEAAEALFAEHGYDGASVNDIVSRARCSVGAFYARFKDKESLFLHLHERQCALLVENADALAAELSGTNTGLETLVVKIIEAQFRFAGARRALTRVFIHRSGHDAAFHTRYALAWGEVAARFKALLMARREEIRRRDPEQAADFVIHMLHASWANDVLHHGTPGIAAKTALNRELPAACLAYLTENGEKTAN